MGFVLVLSRFVAHVESNKIGYDANDKVQAGDMVNNYHLNIPLNKSMFMELKKINKLKIACNLKGNGCRKTSNLGLKFRQHA